MSDKQENPATIQYIATGDNNVFQFPFETFDDSDVDVYIDDCPVSEGFSFQANADRSAGDVVFEAAPAAGKKITLDRNLAIEKVPGFTESGTFRSIVINTALSRIVAYCQLLPVVFPSGFYSGLYFYVDSPRNDLQQVAEVNAWLRENCTGENSAYMICHGVVYSPDVFRISALPDESIREIMPYGACNPGNDAFPKELLTAQVVLTCTPFDPNNHTEKMNAAFLENQEKYAPFELAATFDMGNGYTITAYRRVKAPTAAELDTYRAYLAEENERFPYNFSAVWDELAVQFANNG